MKLSVCTWHLEKRFGLERAFRMIKAAGFDALDFNIDDWCGTLEDIKSCTSFGMSEDEVFAYYTKIYELAAREGLEIGQTHAIFGAPAFFGYYDLFFAQTVNAIVATSALHCHHTVIHPVATEGRIGDEKKDECHKLNLDFFRALIPYLKKYDVKLAIEPMWYRVDGIIRPTICARPEEILEFIDELGSDHFCSCPDLGHFALTGEETGDTPAGALRKLGKTVEIIHAHEIDKNEDRHNKPYTYGTMDWADIASALHEIDYRGTFNFEVCEHYFAKYPDELIPEALRHLAEIGRTLVG